MITRRLTPKGWEIYDTEEVNHADNSGPSAEPDGGTSAASLNLDPGSTDNPGSGIPASPSAAADAGGGSVRAAGPGKPGKRTRRHS
jgi:hypothetical protein